MPVKNKQRNSLRLDGEITGLTDKEKKVLNELYLSKADASTTYVTKDELDNQKEEVMGYLETLSQMIAPPSLSAKLTDTGLAKIQSNVTIDTPIVLTKDTDFIGEGDINEAIESHLSTFSFTIYTNTSKQYYITQAIKLDFQQSASYTNQQSFVWLNGMGTIILGAAPLGNNYNCYINCLISFTLGPDDKPNLFVAKILITPIQKLID